MYNPALYRSARMINPEVQCITIPVDFEDDELARLGLDPALPTGLVSFGGQGSVLVSEIADWLAIAARRTTRLRAMKGAVTLSPQPSSHFSLLAFHHLIVDIDIG